MKKPFLFFLFLFGIISEIESQQWVDKKYEYDSILNVSYGTALNFNGQLETLKMDIYLPACENQSTTANRPLLMWIHGGAFLAGNKEDVSIQALCKSFAKRGYVTASIDYRLGFVSDDVAWQCNYPNYSCVFAADSAEWVRAYYRAVQDGKGALRYLINRYQDLKIDTNNIFVAGESAGAMTALGVGLMDNLIERPLQTYGATNVPHPHPITANCIYNQGINFNGDFISRPDLGGFEGDIEPSDISFKIKGIGNMYGAMFADLLKNSLPEKPKPAIYSFHQPCDIVVSIDSNLVFWGLTWCLTNGYNCSGIINNNVMLYGSRVFSQWNAENNYGYDIQNEFTNVTFPYSFIFGQGSCLDQVNNPCHAYDNKSRRENELAAFFASKITTTSICDTATTSTFDPSLGDQIKVYPNPTYSLLYIKSTHPMVLSSIRLFDTFGNVLYSKVHINSDEKTIDTSLLPNGVYILQVEQNNGLRHLVKVIKE